MPQVYGIGGYVAVGPPVLSGNGAPAASLIGQIGQEYLDRSVSPANLYVFDGTLWNLVQASGGSGSFSTLTVTGQSTLGATTIVGTTLINASGSASTTIATGGTGTLALGNATGGTAVTGNMTWATATQGPVQTAVTASGASPQVANARVFAVTFTGVSIAAEATQSFTISNSTITGSSTVIQYTLVGVTTGGALNIQSVTNSASQSVVVIANGTGATTSTDNITLIGHVLN